MGNSVRVRVMVAPHCKIKMMSLKSWIFFIVLTASLFIIFLHVQTGRFSPKYDFIVVPSSKRFTKEDSNLQNQVEVIPSTTSTTTTAGPRFQDRVIGCFLGQLTGKVMMDHVTTSEQCSTECWQKKSMYSLYFPKLRRCICSNQFSPTYAQPSSACAQANKLPNVDIKSTRSQINKDTIKPSTNQSQNHQGTFNPSNQSPDQNTDQSSSEKRSQDEHGRSKRTLPRSIVKSYRNHTSDRRRPAQRTLPPSPVIVTLHANLTGLILEKYYCRNRKAQCVCKTEWCDSMTCHLNASSCWAGPKLKHLPTHLEQNKTRGCLQSEYHIIHQKPKLLPKTGAATMVGDKEYCISSDDMYGFWPVADCASLHPKTIVPEEIRLYKISPHSIGNHDGTHSTEAEVYAHNRPHQVKLLLLGYYRSGSTFTSELFRNHPDAFYIFEPFYSIVPRDISFQHELVLPYINEQIGQAMSSLYDCNMFSVPTTAFTEFAQMDQFNKVCNSPNLVECLSLFFTTCQRQKLVVIKSIRARMAAAEIAINSSHSDTKVVLLLRDPRGIMNSRFKTSNSPDEKYKDKLLEIKRRAGMLCKAMADDATRARRLKAMHPQQVVIVHYEDIAKHSTTAAQYIYKELGIGNVPQEVKAAVAQLTGGKGKEGDFGVVRKDSLKTAYKWKSELPYSKVSVIDQACSSSYQTLGYQPVGNEQQLKNMTNYHRKFNSLL